MICGGEYFKTCEFSSLENGERNVTDGQKNVFYHCTCCENQEEHQELIHVIDML